jgi:hypothetical protein
VEGARTARLPPPISLGRGCSEGRLPIERWPNSSPQNFRRLPYSIGFANLVL